jgi:phosphatidylinositol 3-kinase
VPVPYKSIPLSSQLAITVWDLSPAASEAPWQHQTPFGGTTLSLFDGDNTLQKGRQKCRLYRHRAADGLSSTTTPAYPRPKGRRDKVDGAARANPEKDPETDEMERIESMLKKQELGEIPRVDWLDQMVFRGLEQKGHKSSKTSKGLRKAFPQLQTAVTDLQEKDDAIASEEDDFFLYLDLPRFDFPVVFSDFEYPAPPISSLMPQSPSSSTVNLKPPPDVRYGPGIDDYGDYSKDPGHRLISIYDPEIGAKDNPAETKHRRLVRNQRTNVLDKDLKPNSKIRDELNVF